MTLRKIVGIVLIFSSIMSFGQKNFRDSVPIVRQLLKGELPRETRLKYLSKLCAHYWMVNPDTSLMFGKEGLALCDEAMSANRIGRHQFVYGMAWENKGNFDSALHYLRKAERTSLNGGDTLYYFRTMEQTGSLFRIMGQYDTALVLMNRALDFFRSHKMDYQTMSALYNIGSVYYEQNRYHKALKYYLESAGYDSLLADTSTMATHQLSIGNIYQNLGTLFKRSDMEKSANYLSLAIASYRQSLAYFNMAGITTGYCFATMGLISTLIAADRLAEADSILHAASMCRTFPDPRIQMGTDINEAMIHHQRGAEKKALMLLSGVSRKEYEIVNLPEYHQAMLVYATLLWNTGNRDSAYQTASGSLAWARSHSLLPVALDACRLLAGWEKLRNNPEKAFDLLSMASQYQDSLYHEIGRETFDQLESNYTNRILRAEVDKLVAETKYHETVNLIIILVGVFAVILLIIIILHHQRRNKISNEQRLLAEERAKLAEEEKYHKETEIKNINLENQLKVEENERLQLEMQLREQDLVFQTILNAELNQKNLTFSEKLMPFRQRLPKKRDQEEFSQALSSISIENQADPMQQFEILFRQMHGGFLEKLLELCPDLSKTDLQICALLRLNLSSKEISRLINLTPATIDGTRHRIRKKLNIDSNTSLTSFLITLK